MAGSGNVELRAPVFNGENYEFWRIHPKSEKAVVDETKKETPDGVSFSEILMKDARALGMIQGAVSDQIFPRIVNEETSKGAWDALKGEFRGDKQVRNVKLQGLRRDFEYTRMKDSESLSVYLSRLFDIINQMKSYGEELSRERIVQKLLISLPKTYDAICSVIEHSRDLETIEVQEVCWYEGKPKCTGCGKPGHSMRDCHENRGVQKVNYVRQMGETGSLFYACNAVTDVKVNNSWYIDSGCSNHMTGDERLLVNIQRGLTSKVKMGTGEICEVAGKGTLVIETKLGRKHIQEVMLVPGLEENLLSVGQMMENGYYLLFGGDVVNIFDGWSLDNLVVRVHMTNNRCFPLTMLPATQYALRAGITHCARIWHKRLGHLNERSLKVLEEQELVHGLPKLEMSQSVCEGCMLGKQHRDSFPSQSTWRAKDPLELIHTDLCGPMQVVSFWKQIFFVVY
ncbi:unnamed protein product [Malus baccata var. baccata]